MASSFTVGVPPPDTTSFFNPDPTPSEPAPVFTVTSVTLVTATDVATVAPSGPMTSSSAATTDNGISAGAVAGISLGLGLFVGLVVATLFYFCRRRRASKHGDNEALLGYQRDEKFTPPSDNFFVPPPPTIPAPHARILEWAQRTRPGSMTSISPSIVSKDASDSEATVLRNHSFVSSRSAYSQASAPRPSRTSEDHLPEFEGPSRPPHLYRISEHE
ncbi:hypothetical protein FB451DRAFT_1550451 [Mycena latifolia]|nr:hypothetical protein FB451DRAFT_1550451 [Mycena latifolia]